MPNTLRFGFSQYRCGRRLAAARSTESIWRLSRNDRYLMRHAGAYLIVDLPEGRTVIHCPKGDQHAGGNQIANHDRIDMAFNMQTGQPIPDALPDPGRWISLGTETIQGQRQTMVWVKPVAMTPRAAVASPIDASKAVQLFRPLESFSREWTERFEYQDLPRPSATPAAYVDVFKGLQARSCPSGTVEALRVESAELLLEARSGGCAAFGEQDEIDRFIFGLSDMFHMVYVVKAHDMTEAQRAIGLRAVNAWNLAP